ncbi:hypothetical protein DSL72_007457 [Monilinia vaccinii-corymbosi]|uniref:EF-hand domain-containing protein n=1 Tax=Monilinia vaccinii-corymbosi TaxID=61207 RepID=A0A8A3PN71_9HELO|nr:hypothetical protein DSL72_007457 [Monilinia vaccinii-corymbosi]
MGLVRIGGILACVGLAVAHGGMAHQKPLSVDLKADWGTKHMAGAIPSNFSAAIFRRGILGQLTNSHPEEHRIDNFDPGAFFTLHDFDNNGVWEPAEILKFYGMEDETAKRVPQEKKMRYHDENTKDEDLIHPEDIAHFKKHDELEDEADRVAALDKMSIVEQNIPSKFRKDRQ